MNEFFYIITDEEYGQKNVSVLLDGQETELEIIDHPASEMSVSILYRFLLQLKVSRIRFWICLKMRGFKYIFRNYQDSVLKNVPSLLDIY